MIRFLPPIGCQRNAKNTNKGTCSCVEKCHEGDLVVASKERLFMFFKNCIPIFKLLEKFVVLFLSPRYTHKTSGFKTSGFKTSGFKTSGFKTSGLQNVRFTKRQVSKRLVSKRTVFKFDALIKQKVYELPSLHCYLK